MYLTFAGASLNPTATAPKWNDGAYVVQGSLQLPYAELNEPFQAFYDMKNKKSRIDYYGGKKQLQSTES